MSDNKDNEVLIVGNGFDRNLGLKTSYHDFIASDIFKNLLATNNQLCLHLKNQHSLDNWIDIENELKEYSFKVCKDSNRKIFRQEFQTLCNSLCEYLNSLEMSNIDETSKGYKLITKKRDLLIINFNYTSSIEYITLQRDLGHKILHIHGRAKNHKIVFGVEDNASINANDVFLKKSTCLWNEILDIESILSDANTILFLGHSLGETDHHYFNNFFRTAALNSFKDKRQKNIFILYYKEDGKYDILKQIDTMTYNKIQSLRIHQNFQMVDCEKIA